MHTVTQLAAEVDGLQISYEDRGTGAPALLFLTGWCGSRAVFDDLVTEASRSRRVLALDWRGHGASDTSPVDFGAEQLVADALAVIERSGAEQIVPVALSHAGWIAIELRRRLGNRVPRAVLLDWIVLDPPPPFTAALEALQSPTEWRAARDGLFAMWLHGLDLPALRHYIHEDMGTYGAEMWARAGREISAAYAAHRNPLAALAALPAPLPTLHLYAQPADPGYLAAQQAYAAEHPWFQVQRLDAASHFPMLENAPTIARLIDQFVG